MSGELLDRVSDGLTMVQAAERLGVHVNTIRNWINSGTLPATRFGPKVIRIRPEDLDALRGPAQS